MDWIPNLDKINIIGENIAPEPSSDLIEVVEDIFPNAIKLFL